jgi:hypothetical protein
MQRSIHLFMTAILCLGIHVPLSAAGAPPVKLYLFVGQSNLDYRTGPSDIQRTLPDVTAWMESEANDVLYCGWSGYPGREDKSDVLGRFTTLTGKHGPRACIEHVIGHRLWTYWKNKDPEQRVAFLHVSRGGTSLINNWNPQKKGEMFQVLDQRLDETKARFAELGLQYEVAGFFWWQGESDTWTLEGPAQYEELFTVLLDHIKAKLEATAFPMVMVRINKAVGLPDIKNKPEGYESGYPARLESVRNSLVKLAEQNNGAWVDIDDQQQKDNAHYRSPEYITVYQRMGDAYFKLIEKDVD